MIAVTKQNAKTLSRILQMPPPASKNHAWAPRNGLSDYWIPDQHCLQYKASRLADEVADMEPRSQDAKERLDHAIAADEEEHTVATAETHTQCVTEAMGAQRNPEAAQQRAASQKKQQSKQKTPVQPLGKVAPPKKTALAKTALPAKKAPLKAVPTGRACIPIVSTPQASSKRPRFQNDPLPVMIRRPGHRSTGQLFYSKICHVLVVEDEEEDNEPTPRSAFNIEKEHLKKLQQKIHQAQVNTALRKKEPIDKCRKGDATQSPDSRVQWNCPGLPPTHPNPVAALDGLLPAELTDHSIVTRSSMPFEQDRMPEVLRHGEPAQRGDSSATVDNVIPSQRKTRCSH
ncbi:MAG: hypothetical protein M1813_005724 [Trichoglossum hirsutum]|nr:MAG: hypothetical protein M1813_005724 [Trichoglossum hirsutum]